jgi:hypothetical protein
MNKEFIKVLLRVQKELPVVGRTTEAFKYKYAPIENIWDKIGTILNENGFVIVNEISKEGVISKAIHELGEISSFIEFSSLTLKPQDRGSEITYARRYNLTAMFNIIVVGEDDDAQTTKTASVNLEKIKAEVEKINDIDALREYYKSHQGMGKEVSEIITARSKYLTEIPVV